MEVVRDMNGNVVARGKNLGVVKRWERRQHVLCVSVKKVAVGEAEDGSGWIGILWEDGSSYETRFVGASGFAALCKFISGWRSIHGSPLTIDGVGFGRVAKAGPPSPYDTKQALYRRYLASCPSQVEASLMVAYQWCEAGSAEERFTCSALADYYEENGDRKGAEGWRAKAGQ